MAVIKLTNLLKEISLSNTQIPAVSTKQRRDVEKFLEKLRIPAKPHKFKNNPKRMIYAMDKKHIMTFMKAMDKADMFVMIPFPDSLGKPI